MRRNNLIILKKAFHWNQFAWAYCLSKNKAASEILKLKKKNVLEIGATKFSQLSLILKKNSYDDLTISIYGEKSFIDVEKAIKKNFYNNNLVNLKVVDIFNIEGTYDLIIMKSILGGLGKNKKINFKIENLISKIIKNNLEKNGSIITMDNGDSLIGKLFFKNLGQRNKNWKYFIPDDFKNSDEIYSFGLFSCISYSVRLKFIGEVIDTINFFLDLLINDLVPAKFRAIHCALYIKKTK